MESHHFNFLNEEDVRKQLNLVQSTVVEKKLAEVKAAPPAYLRNDLETAEKAFKPDTCPAWANPGNSMIVWNKYLECSLGEAARTLKIDLRSSPISQYKPSLLDYWLLYNNGYIARYFRGASEIRKLNEDFSFQG